MTNFASIIKLPKISFHFKKAVFYTFVFSFVFGASVRLAKVIITSAATKNFLQTDWVSGADESATFTEDTQLNFSNYYSATYGIDTTSTPGEVKLKLEISQP